jgi:threonine/homoserine efflux transporter RhtA
MNPKIFLICFLVGILYIWLNCFIMWKKKVELKGSKTSIRLFLGAAIFIAIPILMDSALSWIEKASLLMVGIVVGVLNIRGIYLARKTIHKK